MSSLEESSPVHNNQLAFGILEKELGIPPVMSARDLADSGQIDKLSMVLYLTQIQKAFSVPAKSKSQGNKEIVQRAKKHSAAVFINYASALLVILKISSLPSTKSLFPVCDFKNIIPFYRSLPT